MNFDELMINNDEKIVFILRSLYEKFGYSRYKMNKFEEYELYVRNKDFLVSDNVITFTDTSGKLMALKPDVTLSIVKNGTDGNEIQKVYYNENVYRVSKGTGAFKEIMQVGLECIGNIDSGCVFEVLTLGAKSLQVISEDYVLDISHMGVISEILDSLKISDKNRTKLLKCIGEKNPHDILKYGGNEALQKLVMSSGSVEEIAPLLTEFYQNGLSACAESFIETVTQLEKAGYKNKIKIDFSVLNDLNYYNGIVFKGFVSGISHSVLSGGQYDSLMKKMGRKSAALGFAVYLDILERMGEDLPLTDSEKTIINIALPKGRLGEKVYSMFEKAGFECPAIREVNRKLIFENEELSLRYFWVKPSDVAIYVERGAADIGVCGKDIMLEYEPDVYELADLNLGKCKMAVAAKKGFIDNPQKTLRVATKFSNIAAGFYNSKGRDIDIVHLNGSIEIAPVLDLTDVIVDIVETGTTLKENDLEVIEDIVPISARLIANKSSFKFKSKRINEIAQGLKEEVK